MINRGREVAFLIEGAGKAQVLHDVLLGAYDPEAKPSQLIRPESGKLTLLLDAAAAAKLPEPRAGRWSWRRRLYVVRATLSVESRERSGEHERRT